MCEKEWVTGDKICSENADLDVKRLAIETLKQCENSTELGICLWNVIELYAGEPFFTSKGLPFTYRIKGRELFCDRKEKSITESTFRRAYEKILSSKGTENAITGPKKLSMFGAPYIWSILKQIGLI